MKNLITFILKISILCTLLANFELSAQVPSNHRGLYVDKFIILDNNDNVNFNFSILGNAAKEDELLNYCDRNHIQYITLYDVRKLFYAGATQTVNFKKMLLSDFICKAKGAPHCIQFVGAAIGGFGTTDDIIDFDETQTPAFIFQNPESSSASYSALSFVEQTIPKSDARFKNAEALKAAWQ